MFNLKQLQNSMSKLQEEVKWIPLAYIYITAHFSGLVQALHRQCDGAKLKYKERHRKLYVMIYLIFVRQKLPYA